MFSKIDLLSARTKFSDESLVEVCEPMYKSKKCFRNENHFCIDYFHNSLKNPDPYPYNQKRKAKDGMDNDNEKIQIRVAGNFVTKEYIICADLAMQLYKKRKSMFKKPIVEGYHQTDWMALRTKLACQTSLVARAHVHTTTAVNGVTIGDYDQFLAWIFERYKVNMPKNLFQRGLNNFAYYVSAHPKRKFVYFHVRIKEEYVGSLIFMLYNDICPKTCKHFLNLCRDKLDGITGTPFHRVVKKCWIEGGGYALPWDQTLFDENYAIKHDRVGTLSMSKVRAGPGYCTQFIVTLTEQSWMDHRYVAFGQLIFGNEVIADIERVPTRYDSPKEHICIATCSVYGENTEFAEVKRKTEKYLQAHIEDSVEFVEQLLEEVLTETFMFIMSKVAMAPKNERSGSEAVHSNHAIPELLDIRSGVTFRSILISHQTFPVKGKHRQFYLPFNDSYPDDLFEDDRPVKYPPRWIELKRMARKRKIIYRAKAKTIMDAWLALKRPVTNKGERIHYIRMRDTPLQVLYRKVQIRQSNPTIKNYLKKTETETYFTKSVMALPFSFADSDSDDERETRRKHTLNEVGFSRMAILFDKASLHRKTSYTFFDTNASRLNLAREFLRHCSIRAKEYAAERPCYKVDAYVLKNRIRRFRRSLIQNIIEGTVNAKKDENLLLHSTRNSVPRERSIHFS